MSGGFRMRGHQRRFLVLGHDLEFIFRQIESAKERLPQDTPAWADLDRAEARFQTLALFAKEYSESH